MKVLAINGSPRKGGNTAHLIKHVFEELEREGIDTELVELSGHRIRGCIACYRCIELKNGRCSLDDDILNELVGKMVEADGIVLGSPTYVSDVTAEMKAVIDRATYVTRGNGGLLRRKVGAAVSAVRRAGSIHALDTINHFFAISEMIVPGSSYWNLGIGRDVGEVEDDEEGIRCMHTLGINIAWLLKKINI